MDVLISTTSQLWNDLITVSDEKKRSKKIFEHIKNVEKNDFILPDFPSGLDWFNVSQPLNNSMIRGKVLVVDFFTYCCINCLHIIPHLRHLEKMYSVEEGLVVIGVHSAKFENEKNSAKVLMALNRYNIAHPVINDKDCFLWNKLGVSCWPTILVIGPNHKIIFGLIGEGHKEELLLYTKYSLEYYHSSISLHHLPLSHSDKIVKSNFLCFPSKITRWENLYALSDSGNHRIVVFDHNAKVKFTIGGKEWGFKDGSFDEAKFNSPQGLIFYDGNTLYIADTENHAIRLACFKTLTVSTVVGNGHQGTDYVGGNIGVEQEISSPWDVCVVPCLKAESLQTSSHPSQVSVANASIPPSASISSSLTMPPPPLQASSQEDDPLIFSTQHSTTSTTHSTFLPPPSSPPIPPPPPPPPMNFSGQIPSNKSLPYEEPAQPLRNEENTSDSFCHILLIAASGIHQIWAYFIESGILWRKKRCNKNTCLAVAGTGKEENRNNHYPHLASFAQPSGINFSRELNTVFIADSESSTIRKISLNDGSVAHVAGGSRLPNDLFSYGDTDGNGYDAKFQHPLDVAWNPKDGILYVCDTYNHKIKTINPLTGACTSISLGSNEFSEPSGCCFSQNGNILYVCDTNNHSVKLIHLETNSIQNLELTESEPDSVVELPSKDVWEVECHLSTGHCALHLQIKFLPKQIHGNWNLVIKNGSVKASSLKGNLDTNSMDLLLDFPPIQENGDIADICQVFQIHFNLVLCGMETCNLKKPILVVRVTRKKDAKTNLDCQLTKELIID